MTITNAQRMRRQREKLQTGLFMLRELLGTIEVEQQVARKLSLLIDAVDGTGGRMDSLAEAIEAERRAEVVPMPASDRMPRG